MSKSVLVGLTGGIGSGKSTVAKIFKSLGVPVFHSDIVAKSIVDNNTDVISEIVAEFGDIYLDGELDKVKMATIVFNDKKALETLNKIVHPKVALYFENWVEEHKAEPILIKEAAILIETGAYKHMDEIVLVTAPESVRIQRAVLRDSTSEQKVKDRIQSQLLDTEKNKFADFTINNDGGLLVIPQVLKVYKMLLEL